VLRVIRAGVRHNSGVTHNTGVFCLMHEIYALHAAETYSHCSAYLLSRSETLMQRVRVGVDYKVLFMNIFIIFMRLFFK
jgi:hypothetical protein